MSEPVREITNDTAPGSSHSTIDWAATFKSPEFCAGLQTAVAEAIANSSGSRSLASNVTTLEQMGEVSPSIPSTTTSHASSQGMLTAPVFVGLSDAFKQLSFVDQTVNSCPTSVRESVSAPIVTTGMSSSFNQAFILGPGRPPVPAKLVSHILSGKFIELSELMPENLDAPTTESTSFTIEGRSIVPTTTTLSRKKTEISDILTWIECFNSYISVITACQPERIRDLLAYMNLIMRMAKQFPGRCCYSYDRAFLLEAAASNSKNWSQIKSDLYHYHTSVAVTHQPQAARSSERQDLASLGVTPIR